MNQASKHLRIPALVAALSAFVVVPSALAQTDPHLARRAELNRKYSAAYVEYWRTRTGTGAPMLHLPDVFTIPPQYAGTVTKPERQAMGKRLHLLVDYVLAQTAFQDPSIEVSVDPSLYRVRMVEGEYLMMTLAFKLNRKNEEVEFSLTVNPFDRTDPKGYPTIGQSAGGCRREQLSYGWQKGDERLRMGEPGPRKGTGGQSISFDGTVIRFDMKGVPFDDRNSLAGRAMAVMYGIDCNKLLALTNTP